MSGPLSSSRRRPAAFAIAGASVLLVTGAFLSGPRVGFDERWTEPTLPASSETLVRWVARGEADVPDLRPGDGKEIVWADPARAHVTPLSLVYLHGFSADRHEIEPMMTDVARALGANVFYSRLRGHGRDGAGMAEATVEAWLDDTAEAVAIGARIGRRVLLVGTSTGGTLAMWAAARPEARQRLAGVVMISPNFQPKDRKSRILLLPWGVRIARWVQGDERCFTPLNEAQERHWTTCYPTEVLGTMMALVEHVRTMDLSEVRTPLLVLHDPADEVVDWSETTTVLEGLHGVEPLVRVVRTTSDPAHHVLAGTIMSPTSTPEVERLLLDFAATLESSR